MVVLLEWETAGRRYYDPCIAFARTRREVYVGGIPGAESDAKLVVQVLAREGAYGCGAVEGSDCVERVRTSPVEAKVDNRLRKVNSQITARRGGICKW